MSTAVKVFLSMSISGGLLILALLTGRRFLQNRVSRQWQYYIWIPVLLRLLLPFGPETTLVGTLWQTAESSAVQTVPVPLPAAPDAPDSAPLPAGSAGRAPQEMESRQIPAAQNAIDPAAYLCAAWFMVFLLMLVRKITAYQSFLRYMRAGAVPVTDTELLDRLAQAEQRLGIQKPIELCVNPMADSPMLTGCFRPCIILPGTAFSEEEFADIALHELTHYKRRDIVYKWLVQLTVCLHWFNPLVYRMSREIERACEFSCDEAVLAKAGWQHAPAYGKTLLNAMAAAGAYKEPLCGAPLSENKQLLKERLAAMMNAGKKSKAMWFLTGALTAGVLVSAIFLGTYPPVRAVPASGPDSSSASTDGAASHSTADSAEYSQKAQKAYDAYNLPQFQVAYTHLDAPEQGTWMQKAYTDGDTAFFSLCVNKLKDTDDPLVQHFLQKLTEQIYEHDSIAFFSILAKRMPEEEKETWLAKAEEDEKISFQSMLMDEMGLDDEKDTAEEAWEEALRKEYEVVGVTVDGKEYYFGGQLVHVFLDVRVHKTWYTWDMYALEVNPEGTINIRIERGNDGKITGVAIMTPQEVDALLNDKGSREENEKEDKVITIPVDLPSVPAGEYAYLGVYNLAPGDSVSCYISAEGGERMSVGFGGFEDQLPIAAGFGVNRPDTVYCKVSVSRQNGKLKTVSEQEWPAEEGEYSLFLVAEDSGLTNVTGYVEIVKGT